MGGYFPLFIDLSEKKIQVFGGGTIAARRVKVLLEYGASIQVTAPEMSKELEQLAQSNPRLMLTCRKYRPSELKQPDFVLAATSDRQVNAMIFRECRHKGILVNNASDREMCDFFFPGIAFADDITIGVTSNGKDHKRAAEVTEKIRTWLKGESQ